MLVNARSVELGLGLGRLRRPLREPDARPRPAAPRTDAHVMALPYTPGQLATRFAEEDGALPRAARRPAGRLHGAPQPARARLRRARGASASTYVQLAGGALPVSLSDTVRALKARMLLDTAIAVSPCLDGDLQCVTAASALTLAAGSGARTSWSAASARASSARGRSAGTAGWRSRTPRTPRRRSARARSWLRGSRSATSGRVTRVCRTTPARRSTSASTRCRSRGRTGSTGRRTST